MQSSALRLRLWQFKISQIHELLMTLLTGHNNIYTLLRIFDSLINDLWPRKCRIIASINDYKRLMNWLASSCFKRFKWDIKMKIIALILLSEVFQFSNGNPTGEVRIVGGEDAVLGQFPHQVLWAHGVINHNYCSPLL